MIEVLSRLLAIINSSQNTDEQMESIRGILGGDTKEISEACETYLGYAGNNYLPFLLRFYRSQRSNLFEFLKMLHPKSTSSDASLEDAINFLIELRHCHRKRLNITQNSEGPKTLDLSWVPPKWWKMVIGSTKRDNHIDSVDRRYFEMCLFACAMLELKSGDLFIQGSEKYGDYRE